MPQPHSPWTALRGPMLAGLLVASVSACAEQPTSVVDPSLQTPALSMSASDDGRSMILGAGGNLPADLAAKVTAAGGTLESVIPEIGVAFARNLNTSVIEGAESVVRNLTIQSDPLRTADLTEDVTPSMSAQVASLADNEPLYRLQYGPAAVQAPEAWNAGFTGAGVRVAVLDGGLYNAHLDLAAGVDVAASASFTTGAYNTDVGTFWHGTHVAGIIGARDNSLGVIGIAPNATLIGVKVLHAGSGSFASVLNGIVYAAKPLSQGGAGAHIINMSLGAYIPNAKDPLIKDAVQELAKAIDRATRYANAQGTTVIAAAGNNGSNLDENKFDLNIPGMSARVIGVAATAPLGWALGNTNFSRQASYTNFGKAAVTVAAPGGDFVLPGSALCTIAPVIRPCWVFDMYLSTSRGFPPSTQSYSWAAGTSMASPVVAGIAALIIQANGGSLQPAQVRSKLLKGATDLGKPGFDEVYGHGWVNALNSVKK